MFQVFKDKDFFYSLKKNFNDLSLTSQWVLEVTCYLAAGFIIGFLVKYCGRFIIWISIVTILALWILQMLGIISIHYDYLQTLLGIPTESTVSQNLHLFFQWVKCHISETIAFCLGMYLAWELT